MTADKLLSELNAQRLKLVELKVKNSLGQIKDTSEIKKIKYNIALLNTLLAKTNA
jgi:ribosomal protein L29